MRSVSRILGGVSAELGLSSSRAFSSLVFKENGDPAKVLELSNASPPSNSSSKSATVKTRLRAAPVNPSDLNQIEGVYPIQPVSGLPAVAGNEGLLTVLESPASGEFKKGDTVLVLEAGYGTWAEEREFPAEVLKKVPSDLAPELAATLTINGVTALRMLSDFEDLRPGDTVIQNGANSGVGQMVIQLARARGLRTINIVRDRPDLPALEAHLQSLGADVVTTEAKLRSAAKDLPAPKLGLNCVGGAASVSVAKMLRAGGTIVTYGGMAKEPLTVPTGLLIFKDIQAKGFWLSGRWHREHGLQGRARVIDELVSLAKEGKLRAGRSQSMGLGEFLDRLKAGKFGGEGLKTLLTAG